VLIAPQRVILRPDFGRTIGSAALSREPANP